MDLESHCAVTKTPLTPVVYRNTTGVRNGVGS
jgi:hypothetical protein